MMGGKFDEIGNDQIAALRNSVKQALIEHLLTEACTSRQPCQGLPALAHSRFNILRMPVARRNFCVFHETIMTKENYSSQAETSIL